MHRENGALDTDSVLVVDMVMRRFSEKSEKWSSNSELKDRMIITSFPFLFQ